VILLRLLLWAGDTAAFYGTLQELNDTNKCHFRVHMIGVENRDYHQLSHREIHCNNRISQK
jgi:hypothetical protein